MAGLAGCGKLDISGMGYDNIVTIGDKVWVKADVEEKIWIYQDRPCVVIKFNDACIARMCSDKDPVPRNLLGAVENAQILDCREADGEGGGGSQSESSGSLDTGRDRKANTIRDGVVSGDNKTNLNTATGALDIRSINAMGFQGTAVIPSAAVIPMRSNIRTYGPYASSNFGSSCGGTQVDVNTDLAPWVFGSIELMNNAGQSIVESTAIGLTKAETGAVTIPGLPISQFSSLGIGLGAGGATLSSMNFSYGSGGISTSYEFKTYTPKFGGLNRHLIDRIKDISRNRTEQLRFLRNQQVSSNNITRRIQRFEQRFPANGNANNEGPNRGQSLQRIIACEMYQWQNDGQRTIVGLDTLRKSVGEMVYNYENKAYMSLDGLFGPISKKGDGGLPRYASFEVGCHKTSPEEPIPPFAISSGTESSSFPSGLDQYNLEISQKYLDPLTNNFEQDGHHHPGSGRGHVIDLVGRGSEVTENGLITNFYKPDDSNRYSEDYRFLGMRGPILLHSWGYDTQGKPIPNEADIETDTKAGNFNSENLKDKFLNDWLGKPATWPVAPIDFRFDRKRGVWVTPPGYKVVVAELKETLAPYETAEAQLINRDTERNKEFGPKIFDKDGEEVTATEQEDSKAIIKVVDRLGEKYSTGTRVYCYYDTFNCEYIILQGKQKQTIRFKIIDICENTPVEPDYGDEWTKYAGYGDKFPNNHILGIRINCEGDTIDSKGDFINHLDIAEALNEDNSQESDFKRAKDIFVNLYDTCGQFGAAYAYYDANGGANGYNEWKQKAATGFGLLCDPSPENSCSLGESGDQCLMVDNLKYDSYDIVFLDGYARFVECRLKQELYLTPAEASEKYPQDEFKTQNSQGNASATILQVYGDPGNGRDPKFYKNNNGGLGEIDFRVFDPFFEENEEKNPFKNLKKGDKVVCVFNENLKKYMIYNSVLDKATEVVKFALVDDKNPTQLEATAILVDEAGRPVKKDGTTRIDNQNDFDNNTIIVKDPHMAPPGPGELTVFGPALGSNNLQEHINGIELTDGYENNYKIIGPFIGYALKRETSSADSQSSESSESSQDNTETVYEIITLEHFAKYVIGKVGTITNSFSGNYLGARSGHRQGVIPVGRGHGNLPNKLNVIIRQNLSDFNGRHSFFIGDKVDNPGSTGNVIDDVDGCRFIASLDNEFSTTTNLVYDIIECETSALTCSYHIKDQEYGNKLNKGDSVEFDDTTNIEGGFLHGFMWDPVRSKNHYDKTKLQNGGVDRNDHNTGEIIVGCRGMGQLTGITAGGNLEYTLVTKSEIANIAQRILDVSEAGLFGSPDFNDSEARKINNSDKFSDGLEPKAIPNDKKPIITMSDGQQWMTYKGSNITASWDEYGDPNGSVENCKYKIIYAEEAPVIIQGTAGADFAPDKKDKISVSPIDASSQGKDREPLVGGGDLLTKVENPMGYGAKAGDRVTVMRVFTGAAANSANYKYIVIGTGKPPE